MMLPAQEARSRPYTLPAPMRGWVTNENIAAEQGMSARVLENWFPTEYGVRVRKGSTRRASIGAQTVSMFSYEGGGLSRLFAATETGIHNVTSPADVDVAEDPVVPQQTSGYYSTAYMSTAGGDFLMCVNGTDPALVYNGTNFIPIWTAAVSAINYDALTADFTVGETLTGGTSTATATIIGVRPATATTGTLYVHTISGTFQDNETITDGDGGSATEDGTATTQIGGAYINVASDTFSYVWAFKRRLFFVVKNTLKARYLDVVSIGDTSAGEFDLSGLFQRGGYLLFGAVWSADSGDGMDDRCVFVSDKGEVAVYQGTDPGSNFVLVGRYWIARPLGPRAHFQVAGDLIILTEQGAIPLSGVMTKTPAALSASAITRPIESDWRERVAERASLNWEAAQSSIGNWAVISQPTTSGSLVKQVYAVNLKTGGWALWTGMDALCMAELAGKVYFGTAAGRILEMEAGPLDDGAVYNCRLATNYEHLGGVGVWKQIQMARATFRSNANPLRVRLSTSNDYRIEFPAPPAATVVGSGTALWDTALWDTAVWGENSQSTVRTDWVSIGRSLRVVSMQVQVQIGGGQAPEIDLASIDLLYTDGGLVV